MALSGAKTVFYDVTLNTTKMECAEKAPPLQKPQGWTTQLHRRETDWGPGFDLAIGMLLE
jgi:hypothetical protein